MNNKRKMKKKKKTKFPPQKNQWPKEEMGK
jgi:hypothetical protein